MITNATCEEWRSNTAVGIRTRESTFEIGVVFSEHCIFKRKTITMLHTFTALLCHTIPVETMTIIYLAQIRNI